MSAKSTPVDPALVRELAAILADSGLTEIEIENGDGRIRLARAHPPVMQVAAAPAYAPAPVPAAAAAVPVEEAAHADAVTSPMVGVAYLSSEPSAAPFITAGQSVVAGQTLLLIEAMKTYNQIRATKNGTVSRILVASGQPVEFGQPLLILE
jgi:acetyl-CoA carboxylase biotin carboxyl carrier protein